MYTVYIRKSKHVGSSEGDVIKFTSCLALKNVDTKRALVGTPSEAVHRNHNTHFLSGNTVYTKSIHSGYCPFFWKKSFVSELPAELRLPEFFYLRGNFFQRKKIICNYVSAKEKCCVGNFLNTITHSQLV